MTTRRRLITAILISWTTVMVGGGCAATGSVAGADHPLHWLTGHWVGKGLGGQVEEVWLQERGNAMACVFRLLHGDEVRFYELVTIQRSEAGMAMHLKHFHPNLHGWEDRDEVLVWPATEVGPRSATFGPVRYELVEPNVLEATVRIGESGEERTERIVMRRRQGAQPLPWSK